LLTDLVHAADAPRMLLVLAYRSEYVGRSACLDALSALGSAGAASAASAAGSAGERPAVRAAVVQRELVVDVLAPEETRTLALALLGSAPTDTEARAQVDWIVRESDGRALFVHV